MKYIFMKNKNGKSPKALGILTGASFNLKKKNRDNLRLQQLTN